MRNPTDWHPATVRAHRALTPSVREIELRPEGGVRPWSVGSHLNVQVSVDGRSDTRSYSLVGLPQDSLAQGVYRIAVRQARPGRGGSAFMSALETGAELLIGEPLNHFELSFGAPFNLLVAGGIGITPLLGMARLLADKGAPVRMVYAVREAAELAYVDELRAALGERLQTFVGELGQRLDVAACVATLPPRARAWVCGPKTLLDAMRAAWAAAGRDVADLHFETFGNSGRFESERFWVELPRHGLRLDVPAERCLLDVLNDAGIETLFDCRRGECGLCAMDIVRVEGTIDHRDVFFSSAEQGRNERLCACVSRVRGGGVVLDTAYRPDA